MAKIGPWDGFPKTRERTDANGKRYFEVRPRVLTPQRAKAAQVLATAIATGLTVGGIVYVSLYLPEPELAVWFAVTFFPWIFHSVIHDIVADLIAKGAKIVLTETNFEVHGLFGRRVYDRTLEHSFSLLHHKFAQAELRSHEFKTRKAAQRGKVIQMTPYFAESAVVSFDYRGQPNEILSIYPKTTAHIVLSRLQACDAALNRQTGTGGGMATSPTEEWRDQAGDIPEDE